MGQQNRPLVPLLYGVPQELRKMKIEKVLAMDYRALGRRILAGFKEYIEKVNEQNLKNAVQKNKKQFLQRRKLLWKKES